MDLELTDNWWKEIDLALLAPDMKGQLKLMVSSFLEGTIPPHITQSLIVDLSTSDDLIIWMHDTHGIRRPFEIVVYFPTNPDRHRYFSYLRPFYEHGNNKSMRHFTK